MHFIYFIKELKIWYFVWIYLWFFVKVVAWNENVALKSIGEKEFQQIKAKALLSQHGICWHNAVKAVKNGCDKLNDNEHSVLALHLANCFLEDSGHPKYFCYEENDTEERKDCINKMSDRAFGVYNEFYIHAVHMCFFLNHEIRQAEAYKTINNLYEASSIMTQHLLESNKLQEVILESQREGLRLQNQILDYGRDLGSIIINSTESVTNMVFNFKESVKDQKELLFEIFSYLRTFQNWVITEVSWFQSIIYYTISCILSAILTASKKTSNSRIFILMVLSFSVVIERMLIQYYDSLENKLDVEKIDINHQIWIIRKLALVLCFLSLLYSYYCYKDEHFENFKLLKNIENRLDSLQDSAYICKNSIPTRNSKRLALKRTKNSIVDKQEE